MMRCWDTMKVLRCRETGFEVCEDGVGVLHGTCSTAGCIMTLLSTTLAGGNVGVSRFGLCIWSNRSLLEIRCIVRMYCTE
jgi:hypothetical protein